MRILPLVFSILILAALACQSAGTAIPTASPPASVTETVSSPSPSPAPTATLTSTPPAQGVIHVNTLEQEVYPFKQNGKCSLGEAILAANLGKSQDSCEAGIPKQSVIELMPGEYHFTQVDHSPPQFDWLVSVVSVGDALPPIVFPLTIHGNGAILVRDDGAEPFRFFELLTNSGLTLSDITLQNGDVQNDWGGAIYSTNNVVNLDHIRFINNHAANGGAIYFDLGALTIQDGEFNGNFANLSGGAMYIDSSRATIQSTRFEANESNGDGGGLYASTVRLVLKDSFFIKNRVTGKGYGTEGGGISASHVDLNITESQFYQNESPLYGGAVAVNDPILAGTDPEDGDPIKQIQQSPMTSDMLTSIPGFQATLEAHPSGIFIKFEENIQIHNNCFANNVTINPDDPNWTSGLLGRASMADGNYWGDPSGPSGMGPGRGDSVGKRLTFSPFLKQAPPHCDPTLAEHN